MRLYHPESSYPTQDHKHKRVSSENSHVGSKKSTDGMKLKPVIFQDSS